MQQLRSFLPLAILLVASNTESVLAQAGRQVPRISYYAAKEDFYAGAFRRAERGFLDSARSGVRYGDRRWIDSICYYSMLGEYYYQLGQYPLALQNHDLALNVYLANSKWMLRIQFPPALTPTNRPLRAKIGWGVRTTFVPEFPESMSSFEGTVDQQQNFQRGGVIDSPHLRSVDPVEVARCMAVSLRRRAELLGPVCPYTPLSGLLSNALGGSVTPAGHWSSAWGEVLYGLALIGDGQTKEARPHLVSGTTVGGFDHQLTGISLLELGKLSLQDGDFTTAAGLFHQASIAGAEFRQADLVDESFRYLTDAFLANEGRGVYPPIDRAILWATSEDFFRARASMLLCAGEVAIYANDPVTAAAMIDGAAAIISRLGLVATSLGSRLNYLMALTQYRGGNAVAANKSMVVAMAHMQNSSLRLYQRTVVETLHAQGRRVLSPRRAERLFSIVLREPTEIDWRTQPLETMASMAASHNLAMEKWFELLVDRKELDEAVFVAEQLKRHRFYSTLPFGGRLLALRWLVEGDQAMLGTQGLQRQAELRTKYPALVRNSRESQKSIAKLRAIPMKPTDEEQSRIQKEELSKLLTLSEQQENLIREISLRREPAPLVFPPQPSLTAIQQGMRHDQAILMFVTTQAGWHAWFIRKESDKYWSIKSPRTVRNAMAALLRGMGNRGRNDALPLSDVTSDAWKKPAAAVWKNLIGQLPSNGWDELEELIIIPDGLLWYLPFEALLIPQDQLPDATDDQLLIDLVSLRYSPTASFSVADARGHDPKLKTTFIAGQLFPRESSDPARAMLAKLKESLPEVEVVGPKTPGNSGLYSSTWDRLIVWNDIDRTSGPYGWAPAQFDRGRSKSLLSDWMEYPWGSPDQVILPGFHTAAEAVLHKKATGYEIYSMICGMMSTGTRTILMSRWRVGGNTPTVLVREFAGELPQATASKAWQRAVDLVRVEQLSPDDEPRLSGTSTDPDVSAEHPFFWAGYMLVDTGSRPKEKVDEKAEGAKDEVAPVEEIVEAKDKVDEEIEGALPADDMEVEAADEETDILRPIETLDPLDVE